MDRHLIAPVPDGKKPAGIWRVNETRLDDRIEGQRELVAIAGKSVIPPAEEKFYPALGRVFKMLGVRRRGIWTGNEEERSEHPRSGL
jgi:hypothetical protein